MGLKIRELIENSEELHLSPYAQLSKNSKGRREQEEECSIRTIYQRDRDRIIHCQSFRKLKEKTQVFIVKDDFFRTRLTHTLEVSQIARTIARALRINEDLVEAIALGHDLGHTCFGHCGEDVLQRLTGSFKHNEQSLRVVDVLENDGRGLNLSLEVRDGIINHTGDKNPFTLEGQLVKVVDRVTYLCHDIQDSINANILRLKDLPQNVLQRLGKSHGERINTFVIDIIETTEKNLKQREIPMIYQSEEIEEVMDELRRFMFANVYYGEICLEKRRKAEFIVESLYRYFLDHPEEIPKKYYDNINEEGIERVVTDYIAGFTDSYAITLFKEKFIPSK